MKIILSRKGFDRGCGGVASPILPDGRMVSLPIPYSSDTRRYHDISWCDRPLSDLVHPLTGGQIQPHHTAHLDPDIARESLPRQEGWLPAFGQIDSAQSHLRSQGVGRGDLFLFFGWFRNTTISSDGTLKYNRRKPHIHALFGWLMVDEVISVGCDYESSRALKPWLADHPHLNGHGVANNTIYVAAPRLAIEGQDMGVEGGGVFKRFDARLCLTASGHSRSVWHLPRWFDPEFGAYLSYHEDAARWSQASGELTRLKSVARGQEFVIDCAAKISKVQSWIRGLLETQTDSC